MNQVIVIGVPRSGTTVLASMIGSHSQVSMMDECHSKEYLKQIGTQYVGNKIACDGMIFSYKEQRIPFLHAIINRIINIPFKKQFIRLPMYDFSAEDLIYDDAKFVIIYRDKEDTIMSNHKRGGMPMWVARLKYKYGMKVIRNLTNGYDIKGKRIHYIMVKYEDMLADPWVEMSRMCDFLNIRDESALMVYGSSLNKRYGRKIY